MIFRAATGKGLTEAAHVNAHIKHNADKHRELNEYANRKPSYFPAKRQSGRNTEFRNSSVNC